MSVEMQLYLELKKRIEVLEKKVELPEKLLGISWAENERRKERIYAPVFVDPFEGADSMKPGEVRPVAKPPLAPAPADAVAFSEGDPWKYVQLSGPGVTENVYAVHFVNGWVWDRIAGWHHAGDL